MRTLIVPCAGRSTRFPNMRPKWLLTHPDGQLMIQKALSKANIEQFDQVIFSIVQEHNEKYEAELILSQGFPDKKYKVTVLPDFTHSASETVYQTLVRNGIDGPFVVKDSDNVVDIPPLGEAKNFVVGLNLNVFGEVSNLKGKSFIKLNKQNFVIDIVEKKIVSEQICLGVYGFESSKIFLNSYQSLTQNRQLTGELYLSHVISYLIGAGLGTFQYFEAKYFEDWGTLQDWRKVQEDYSTYLVDIDGVLIKNHGKYGSKTWDTENLLLDANVEALKKLQGAGAQIILMTSRPEAYREKLTAIFKSVDLKFQQLIMGCHHAPRILINDFAVSNPFPSCRSISIPRDGTLSSYLS
jgi:NDP-sugar pyrophosphorylase family protein